MPGCKPAKVVITDKGATKTVEPTTAVEAPGQVIFSMSRHGCFGACPIYGINLYADGHYTYEGVRYVEKMGLYCGKLSTYELQAAKDTLAAAHLMDLKDRYPVDRPVPVDVPSVDITYFSNGVTKKITTYNGGMPLSLERLQNWADELVKRKDLHQCDK